MQTFLLITAVVILPLALLAAWGLTPSMITRWYCRRPLAWHRTRRQILRALGHGALLR
jgi:ABC-type phosphate/phosphonate transport system permease subunit